eukprot:TRINITY_DN14416_c0_g5_i1.p1 TRINITY_DN14416_c0_g5~~TRINITY_DN14416_c0_g5_i1.p1  ORF type:complete len:433 (+),score=56.51 TRINITY_DN14416_c0_g5_i1:79-1377(+)
MTYYIKDNNGKYFHINSGGYFTHCEHDARGEFEDHCGGILVKSGPYTGKYMYASADNGYICGYSSYARKELEWASGGPMVWYGLPVDIYKGYYYSSARWFTSRDLKFTKEYVNDIEKKIQAAAKAKPATTGYGQASSTPAVAAAPKAAAAPAASAPLEMLFEMVGRSDCAKELQSLAWTDSSAGLKVAPVPSGSMLFDLIEQEWAKTSRGFPLVRIELVMTEAAASLRSMAWQLGMARQEPGPFNIDNFVDADFQAGLQKLKRSFITGKSPDAPERANFLFTWHGTSHSVRHKVAAFGIRSLRTTDGGFFGGGSYSALEAWYAAKYTRPDPSSGERVALLLFTAVGLAYVVTRGRDYTGQAGPNYPGFSDLFSNDARRAIAMLPGYDTQFIPVKYVNDRLDYQACPASEAEAHEVVSENFTQCYPLAFVYFR